jgi:signal transduction histidine kinase
MPYGRTDSDIFGIEERRSKNAGRYFWSHRQCFGRVAFTREDNPNLRDKAGREGLVDNQAKREMIRLVEELLVDLALRFFGRESNIRKELMPGIKAANQLALDSLKKSKKTTQKHFSSFIRSNSREMENAVAKVVNINQELRQAIEVDDSHKIISLMEKEDELSRLRSELKLPPLPAKLGNVEKAYRAYRDNYLEMTAALQSFTQLIASIYETHIADQKDKVVRRKFFSNQAILNSKINKWVGAIDERLEKLNTKWEIQAAEDRQKYYEKASPIVDDIDSIGFGRALNVLDVYRNEFEDDFTVTYESFLRSLDKLEDDINLDSALWIVEKENTDLEEQVKKLNNLAQLGVAVEIIGHELDTLDSEVGRNLMRLPRDVRNTEAFKLTYESYKALVNRLRFLAPMKLAGYQAREDITGAQLADYIDNFFHRHFKEGRIEFVATEAFRDMTVRDLVSRIYPVFINLVNNAVYWLRYVEERKLVLDLVDGIVIVADSGDGVDQDDVPHLFDIFFSRRPKGRGVGLYLCKVNLAVSYHKIYYIEDKSEKILPGANFAIEFKGMKDV